MSGNPLTNEFIIKSLKNTKTSRLGVGGVEEGRVFMLCREGEWMDDCEYYIVQCDLCGSHN